MKKKIVAIMAILFLLPVAKKAEKSFNNDKTIIVDYFVDEKGKPNVVYIENIASPNKLEKIIEQVESTTIISKDLINKVVSVKVKV